MVHPLITHPISQKLTTLYLSQVLEDSKLKPQVEWVKKAAKPVLPVEDCDVLTRQKILPVRV